VSSRTYTKADVGEKLDRFLQSVIEKAGFDLDYEYVEGLAPHPDFENPDLTVRFAGPDVDLLLANRAELLLAMEHVAMEYLRMPSEDHSRLCFDANDYRALRIEELRLSAAAAAERVRLSGRPFLFNPMNSRERRVIHLALRDEPAIRSESTGTGPKRQVVVYPEGMPSIPPTALPSSPPPRSAPRGGPPRRGDGRGGRPPRGPRRGPPRR